DRIPNRPYLYGNTQLTAHWPAALGLPGQVSVSVDSRWVHSYYLFWESQGAADTKFSVPGQLSHNASLVYAAPVDRYSLALECHNLTDADLYDNFRQQKPGRAFSAKVRFSL
ncbi:MAG TPA: TonB-dependent receptor, partial [Fibrobacteria bacterium]|nr:TonB-dependent receptor [Fibrobacteria bacterium]